jgi:hypothetical protein
MPWPWSTGPLRDPARIDGWLPRGAIGNFRAEPAPGGSRIWTETWAFAPARNQTFLFTCYWLLIGPFSAWIRRMLLGAARRRARAGAGESEVRA